LAHSSSNAATRPPVLGEPSATAGTATAGRVTRNLTRAPAGIFTVRDIETVTVQIEVLERDIAHVRVGSPDR